LEIQSLLKVGSDDNKLTYLAEVEESNFTFLFIF